MSFREKSAWVTLIAIVLVSAMYVFHIPQLYVPHSRWVLKSLAASLGAFLLIELVAYAVLRVRNPTEARTPKDELEKLIDLKALRIAAYVYIIGSFVAIFVTLHVVGSSAGMVAVAVLLAFVVAEMVNYTARIVYYRRIS